MNAKQAKALLQPRPDDEEPVVFPRSILSQLALDDEIGAAFLCAALGITPETRDDHAAYIGSWLQVLKNDKRAIFTAASHAQKAADYLHSLQTQT